MKIQRNKSEMSKKRGNRAPLWHATAMVVILGAGMPTAHAAEEGAAEVPADEIVVTAQKREERLSDVPMSLVAASGQQLENAGVSSISQLAKVVPGFTSAASFDAIPVFSLRGVGFVANQLAAAPAVSTYVDEVPLPYSAMNGGVLLDVERVEALKGPQGILFGQNSTAGSVNFVAAKPTADFSAGIEASIARFGQVSAEGFVSGPLNDQLRARVSGMTTQGGAWQKSYTGPDRKHGDADRAAARVILDWTPTDRLKFTFNANGYYDRSEVQLFQLVGLRPGRPSNLSPDLASYPLPPTNNRAADWDLNPPRPLRSDNKFWQLSLKGEYEISDSARLTSVTSYSHLSFFQSRDPDATSVRIANFSNNGDIDAFSQELRLSGSIGSGIDYIVGLSHTSDNVKQNTPQRYVAYSATPPNYTVDSFGNFRSHAEAAFASVDWSLTDRLTLTTGARYTRVEQHYTSCTRDSGDGTSVARFAPIANAQRAAIGLPPTTAYQPGGCVTIGPASTGFLPFLYDTSDVDDNISWRTSLNYKPNNNLLFYGNISRGYKAGAYPFLNAPLSNQFKRVKQEKLTAYEVGIKYSDPGAFSINAAGFYYDYINKQTYDLTTVPIFLLLSALTNVPKSEVWGVDIDATLAVSDRLTLRGGVNYSHTEVKDLFGYSPSGVLVNEDGNPLPFAPRWSAVGDAEYRAPVTGDMEIFLGGGFQYNSRAFSELSGAPALALPSYLLFDLRAGVEAGPWKASIWGRNLTDKHYWTSANVIVDTDARLTGMPRTYGLTVGYRF